MEKIRSGQSFLYREGGLNSTVLDIRMKERVRGDFLQRALTIALQRYPYMTSKLVEKDGDFYLEKCFNSMTVIQTEKYRALGSVGTGYHLVDVTFVANSIRIAFHHALCDGRGIKPFAETLVYYYCCLRYGKVLDATGVRLAESPLLPGETQEPVGDALFAVDENNLPHVTKAGYALPENTEECENYYRYEVNMNRSDFLNTMKACGATPAILLALLVSGSIQTAHPNHTTPIVCSMAMDYRKEIGQDNTHKNCVGSLYLPYSAETESLPLPERAELYRQLIKEQRTPDAVRQMVNVQIGLCQKLDELSSLAEKQQALAFFNNMCIDTYVISYLGQMQFGEAAYYIESTHLYNSGVKGLRINMIDAGENITVDILQSYTSNVLVAALLKALGNIGVRYTASEPTQFETTKDKAYITAGKQAERYYKVAI